MSLLLLVAVYCSPRPQPHYFILKGTTSPHRSFAFACGFRDKNVDWKRIHDGDNVYLDTLGWYDDDVVDYLVNVTTKKILAKIDGVHYFESPTKSHGHDSIKVSWSRDEKQAMVVYDGKWTFHDVVAIQIERGTVFNQQSIGGRIKDYVRSSLKRNHEKSYQKYADKIAITLDEGFRKRKKSFEADISALIPKRENLFFYGGRLLVTLVRGKRTPLVKLYGLRSIKVDS